MQINNYEINVLVKGKPIREYYHNGETFIEGRDGSNFEIEFINRTGQRVEAIIAVDGLSILDGETAGPESAGYAVEARQTLRIPGWKLDSKAVAAFLFAGKKASYAAQKAGGSSRNTGVIGAMVFKEKEKPRAVRSFPIAYPQPINHLNDPYFNALKGPMSGGYVHTTLSGDVGSLGACGPAGVYGSSLDAAYNPMSVMDDYFICQSATSSMAAPIAKGVLRESAPSAKMSATEQPTSFNLGTGFGEKTDFVTHEVQFERGDLAAMMVVYYDDARGLRARGIEIGRKKERAQRTPEAFPGLAKGCTPPVGWKG